MKLIRNILLLLLLLGIVGIGYILTSLKRGMSFTISEAQIEQQLAKKFPIEKTTLKVLKTTLDQPNVDLEEGFDKLRIQVDAMAESAFGKIEIGSLKIGTDKTFRTSAVLEAGIEYDPTKARFYMVDPKLLSFDADKVPESARNTFRDGLNLIAREFLDRVPVYTLKQDEAKHDVAMLLLDHVSIENGRVRVTMKLPEEAPTIRIERSKPNGETKTVPKRDIYAP